jgi:HrpA-like RNA helicase
MISKMILSANDFGCSDEILTIAAFLSVQVSICLMCPSFFVLFYSSNCSDTCQFIIVCVGFYEGSKEGI